MNHQKIIIELQNTKRFTLTAVAWTSLIISFLIVTACGSSNEAKQKTTKNTNNSLKNKTSDSIFIDSVYVRQAFFGFSVHKGYKATCRSYLLNDFLSNILMNNARYILSKDENSEESSRLSLGPVNLIDTKQIELLKLMGAMKTDIRYHKIPNPHHYGSILVELYVYSPDLELGSVELIDKNTLKLSIRGCLFSSNVKNRYTANTFCKMIFRIQVPNIDDTYRVVIDPTPYTEWYVLVPVSPEWQSQDKWN